MADDAYVVAERTPYPTTSSQRRLTLPFPPQSVSLSPLPLPRLSRHHASSGEGREEQGVVCGAGGVQVGRQGGQEEGTPAGARWGRADLLVTWRCCRLALVHGGGGHWNAWTAVALRACHCPSQSWGDGGIFARPRSCG